jgi:ureidoglycolate lyase
MSVLIPRPLTAEAFAPFGDVLSFDPDTARPVNGGNAMRGDLPARLAHSGGMPRLALFRVAAKRLPLTVTELEQHPHSSQTFVPITVDQFLIVVAPSDPDGSPGVEQSQAFIGTRGQGINYRLGVWHAPIIALDAGGDFLMLIWEQGTAADCHVDQLAHPIQVAFNTP